MYSLRQLIASEHYDLAAQRLLLGLLSVLTGSSSCEPTGSAATASAGEPEGMGSVKGSEDGGQA